MNHMWKYRNVYKSGFVLGLSPTVYGVTASHAKKKEGGNLAHKAGDLGLLPAHHQSHSTTLLVPILTLVSLRREVQTISKDKAFSFPSRKKQSAWDECPWSSQR